MMALATTDVRRIFCFRVNERSESRLDSSLTDAIDQIARQEFLSLWHRGLVSSSWIGKCAAKDGPAVKEAKESARSAGSDSAKTNAEKTVGF